MRNLRFLRRPFSTRNCRRIDHEPYVLYEDKNIMVVNKPAGMVSQSIKSFDVTDKSTRKLLLPDGVATDSKEFKLWKTGLINKEIDLIAYFKYIIKATTEKPGNVWLTPVFRLDTPVSGIVVLAKRDRVASRLTKEVSRGNSEREFIAVVEGDLLGHGKISGSSTSYKKYWKNKSLSSNPLLRSAIIKKQKGRKEQEDTPLEWSAIHHFMIPNNTGFNLNDKTSMRTVVGIRCRPQSKHQIRRQMASLGHPIVGDWMYGSSMPIRSNARVLKGNEKILLHHSRLKLKLSPIQGSKEFLAPLPQNFLQFSNIDISEFGGRFYDIKEAERLKASREAFHNSHVIKS